MLCCGCTFWVDPERLNVETEYSKQQQASSRIPGVVTISGLDSSMTSCSKQSVVELWLAAADMCSCVLQSDHTMLLPALLHPQSSPPEGSILFSYVQTDEFCERFEASKCITTSRWDAHNHLARKLATDARNRQKVRRSGFQTTLSHTRSTGPRSHAVSK
jgi:hypothetical protein